MAGDFTGDGHLDLAVSDQQGSVDVLLGNGDGTFQPAFYYVGGFNAYGLVEGDFTGDGHLDLAVATGTRTPSRSCWATATGRSNPPSATRSGTIPTRSWRATSMAVASSTWPSRTRTTIPRRSYWVTVMGRSDRPSSPVGITYPGENGPAAIAAGDFNGDGRLDLAVANYNTSTVSILIGNGDGTFRAPVDYSLGTYTAPEAIAIGDFNGDGRLDLAVADTGTGTVSILLGNGDGTFQPAVSYSTEAPITRQIPASITSPDAIVVGDFNGDGKLGLAVADLGSNETISYPDGTYQSINVQGGVSVLLGNGDGTFQPALYDAIEPADILVAGDFNGDGKLDLAIGNQMDDSFVLLIAKVTGRFNLPVTSAGRKRAWPGGQHFGCDGGRGLRRKRPARSGRPG